MSKAPAFTSTLKGLIWLYLALLLSEGALRKWIVPGLSNELLIARDPLVILIYIVALSNKRFVVNGFVMLDAFLAIMSFVGGMLSPDSTFIATLIGLRCYFLHLPLIFVMERTLDREDVFRMGRLLLWVAVPETLLVVDQFYSPQSALVNFDVGGNVGVGMPGALDRFRPSGTFSFTTGVSEFYPLALAMLLGLLISRKKLSLPVAIAAGLSILVAVPFSISRTNFLTCIIVLLTALLSMLILPKLPMLVVRCIVVAGALACILPWLGFFSEGLRVFEARWADSNSNSVKGFQTSIVERALNDIMPPTDYILNSDSLMGEGVGYGTMMAQAYLTGKRNFALGESEWPRILLEMGPILGLIFIGMRVALCGRMLIAGLLALRRDNVLPILICVDGVLLVLNGQWGQPTTLGFATFTAGLTFAAANISAETVTTPVVRARRLVRRWEPPPTRQPWQPLGSPLPEPKPRPQLTDSPP